MSGRRDTHSLLSDDFVDSETSNVHYTAHHHRSSHVSSPQRYTSMSSSSSSSAAPHHYGQVIKTSIPATAAEDNALYNGDEEGDEVNEFGNLRTATVLEVAVVAFFLVSGGPIGLEQIVQAAGPLYAIVALLLFPLLWAVPQAFITAELATMMPQNGGYIIWTTRAFGDFGGFLNGFISLFTNIFDLALYPVLVADYLDGLVSLSPTWRWITIIATVTIVFITNMRGIAVVGRASVVFAIMVLLPFITMFFVVLGKGELRPKHWLDTIPSINWRLFFNMMFWNFSGWDALSCIAGEVKDPKRTYPRAVAGSLIMVILSYLIPILAAVSVNQMYYAWDDGYFVDIGENIESYFATWIGVAAIASSLGIFNATTAANSRALWRIGQYHMLPESFGYSTASGVPVVALVFHLLLCIALASFSFDTLVEVDNFLFGVSLSFEKASFLYLKWREPDAPRPFAIPGGVPGAFAVAFPVLCVCVAVVVLATWQTWALSSLIIIIIALLYYPWRNRWLAKIIPSWQPTVPLLAELEIEFNHD
jgi:amino acid transporter